ncbi:hypothetical protein N9165_03535, partial [Akkermansiaceae bacterium]|nr:hypothetical protein [Akkermansiaceae bacterium]
MKKIEQARAELGDLDVVGTGARNFDPQKRTLQSPLKKPTKRASKPAPADESRSAPVRRSLGEGGNSSKPNFVIIFTDDQGYADLSCFGGKHVYTPNID